MTGLVRLHFFTVPSPGCCYFTVAVAGSLGSSDLSLHYLVITRQQITETCLSAVREPEFHCLLTLGICNQGERERELSSSLILSAQDLSDIWPTRSLSLDWRSRPGVSVTTNSGLVVWLEVLTRVEKVPSYLLWITTRGF